MTRHQPYYVRCRKCGAEPTAKCRTSGGLRLEHVHARRRFDSRARYRRMVAGRVA